MWSNSFGDGVTESSPAIEPDTCIELFLRKIFCSEHQLCSKITSAVKPSSVYLILIDIIMQRPELLWENQIQGMLERKYGYRETVVEQKELWKQEEEEEGETCLWLFLNFNVKSNV